MAAENERNPSRLEPLELVRWVAGLGSVTAEALAAHQQCSVASARGRLSAVERLGWLARWRPLVGQPALYTATLSGLRVGAAPGLRPARISASTARHALACCGAAASMECAYPGRRVIGEPELRLHEREQGRPIYSVQIGGSGVGGRLHRPDLVLLGEGPDEALPIAVEVELTVKAPRRLASICRAWARCRYLAGVIYLTTPDVREPLSRAIEREQAGGRIVQVDLDALECDRKSSLTRAIPGSA